jgi:hypothetical protein
MYNDFFKFMNERHMVYLRRNNGVNYPWTEDKILTKYKFTNVFRELDATTVWFKKNIREPMADDPDVAMATIIFRWFNLINSGRLLLKHDLLKNWDSAKCYNVLEKENQWVTGAYIIKTPNGMNKLEGVCWAIDQIFKDGNKFMDQIHEAKDSLQKLWNVLLPYPYMGPFMAYEVVTDWRHTWVGRDANDILTWANPGPGAKRGLHRIHGRNINKAVPYEQYVKEMQEILEVSPNHLEGHMPPLEMREVEHTLCEFDKYERVRNGEGKPRSIYVHEPI